MALGIICTILLFILSPEIIFASDIFHSISKDDPSNAVQAIQKGGSLMEFLDQLFDMSFSENQKERLFAGANIADIASGSLSYSSEFGFSQKDWDAIIDAFLVKGYLTCTKDKRKQGYAILIWQRPSEFVRVLRVEMRIPKPEIMKEDKQVGK